MSRWCLARWLDFSVLLFLEETLYYGMIDHFMVESLESGVEVKKLDAQGRLILPADWREAEVGESRELYIVKRKGYLKIVPKRRVDLTENFDKVDLGVDAIGSWREFEKKFYEASA
jgi:bifunctional DNA-binding transcriptional regulator/antitoxin component of YhaV-PrlF toxin-antitoxin module